MRTIITHPGAAHRDEFMACCLLLGHSDHRIERREPTADELQDPATLVVDVGGRHEPEKGNFDHHQLPRDHAPTCAVTLILPLLDVSVEEAREVWRWFEATELLDSKGPFALARVAGCDPDWVFRLQSPIEATLLRQFGDCNCVVSGIRLYFLMQQIGQEQLQFLQEVRDRLELLRRQSALVQVAGRDFHLLDATCVAARDNPVLGLELYVKGLPVDVPVTVTQDDRGEGLCLFRRNDDPRVDFSRVLNDEGVVFVHNGGFVVKTRDRDMATALRLIQQACVA